MLRFVQLGLFTGLACSLLMSGRVAGADDLVQSPDVVFPDISPPTPPVPTPVGAAVKLPYDTLYVFTANGPCLVVSSPEGLIEVHEEKGPIKIMGKFVEGKTEYRNYTRPFVFVVTAVPNAVGTCELIVRYEGPKPGPVQRRKFLVGESPRPPPVPPQPPTPPVPPQPPPSDPFFTALQAAYALEASPEKAKQVQILAAFYRSASQLTVNNPGLKTLGELQDTLKLAVKQIGLPPGSLSRLIPVIAEDIKKSLGDNPAVVLDGATRNVAAVEYMRVTTALEALK